MIVDPGKYISKIWFSNKIDFSVLTVYYQSSVYQKIPGMISKAFYTKIIDLQQPESQILADFEKGTKYEIRRAQVDGIVCSAASDPGKTALFYNDFAKTKNLGLLNAANISSSPHKFFTIAKINENVLVCHLYICDKSKGRVRLLNSGTKITDGNSVERALIGRANRYLHFWDISYFKNLGFTEYDLGGYAYGTSNKSLLGINSFKDSFGGEFVKEYHYFPLFIWLGLILKQYLSPSVWLHWIKKN